MSTRSEFTGDSAEPPPRRGQMRSLRGIRGQIRICHVHRVEMPGPAGPCYAGARAAICIARIRPPAFPRTWARMIRPLLMELHLCDESRFPGRIPAANIRSEKGDSQP